MKKIFVILSSFFLVSAISCQNEKGPLNENVDPPKGNVTEYVTGISGLLTYSNFHEQWTISVSYPGTIDSRDIYLLGDYEYNGSKEISKEVLFSGNRYWSEEFVGNEGGLEIYCIIIEKIEE